MQPAAEAHDTPVRLSMLPFGAEATLTADHVVPSHASAIALCRELSSPTARQELAEAHDTPLSVAPNVGVGSAWIDHELPSHASARVCEVPMPCWELPTAVHALAEAQDTALKSLVVGPGAVVRMPHAVPFQTSARASLLLAVKEYPTATQALAEVHDTPLSCPPCASATVCWIDHAVPFHTSSSGALPVEVLEYPTAMQNVAEAQETPVRMLDCAPCGLGVRCTVQAEPFHASASVTPAPALFCRLPTATQGLTATHDTAVSRPCGTSGLGVGCTAQAVERAVVRPGCAAVAGAGVTAASPADGTVAAPAAVTAALPRARTTPAIPAIRAAAAKAGLRAGD